MFAVALQQTFALIWVSVLLPFELSSSRFENLLQLDGMSWFWAGVSGVLYYALAFWFYLKRLVQLNASTAGAFINLVPIFGISGAYIFLGERLTILQLWN